ncbi:MAG: hypothetical protein HYY24_16190 [Verrucomicrobia bacterium]|nr:hypothetical protein [Verrucomicrobiota bacterium]
MTVAARDHLAAVDPVMRRLIHVVGPCTLTRGLRAAFDLHRPVESVFEE